MTLWQLVLFYLPPVWQHRYITTTKITSLCVSKPLDSKCPQQHGTRSVPRMNECHLAVPVHPHTYYRPGIDTLRCLRKSRRNSELTFIVWSQVTDHWDTVSKCRKSVLIILLSIFIPGGSSKYKLVIFSKTIVVHFCQQLINYFIGSIVFARSSYNETCRYVPIWSPRNVKLKICL